ncbi:hypothetical protein NliqN6_1879 [Naganishia liquefaciens]|uniref:SET domain-containing protein n=1 Tax=Naganishia liquefaciens TaxID=104408 RepID=A0A8H3TQR6_9TREE|nr:hypothetical protein NliqN6_1879 [Naganishia liquefaciens]
MASLLQELKARIAVDVPHHDLAAAFARYRHYTEDLFLTSGGSFSALYSSEEAEEEGCGSCEDEQGVQCAIGSNCSCVSYTGNFYSSSALLSLPALPPNWPLVECGASCQCSARCSLRVTQRGPSDNLVLRLGQASGLGIFADAFLPSGRFICLYAGEFIDQAQARQRFEKQQCERQGNYILCMRENDAIIGFVDPTIKGNIGRFLNYSCDPNCRMEYVRWGPLAIPRPAIFTIRDIAPGEELTWDYGSEELSLEVQTTNENSKTSRTRCFCDSKHCKGYLPYDASI